MREYRFRGGRRKGRNQPDSSKQLGRGRPLKDIMLDHPPETKEVNPKPLQSDEEIHLSLGEYEALRLVDFEGLNQIEAGEKMHVSRGTIWRLLDSGRKKLIQVIIEGRQLKVGDKKEKSE